MTQRTEKHNGTHCSGSRRNGSTRGAEFPLHRIAEVMQQEGVTPRAAAGRLNETRASVVRAAVVAEIEQRHAAFGALSLAVRAQCPGERVAVGIGGWFQFGNPDAITAAENDAHRSIDPRTERGRSRADAGNAAGRTTRRDDA